MTDLMSEVNKADAEIRNHANYVFKQAEWCRERLKTTRCDVFAEMELVKFKPAKEIKTQ